MITYFKTLADPARVRLLNILLHHELSVNEIVALVDSGQSRVSHHLRVLMDAGFLRCRRDGVRAFYSAAPEGPARRFVDAVHYLFATDPDLRADLDRAAQAVEERRRHRMDFFNSIAPEWDRLKQEIIGDFDLNTAIVSHVPSGRVTVDLGCGTGDLLAAIRPRTGRVIGVDSSPRMLEEARKRFLGHNGEVDLRLGELEHLPLGNGEADVAVMSLAMHHVFRPEAAMAEVNRILRDGGVFILVDFARHDDETLRDHYGDHWLGFDREEISRWLAATGFEPQATTREPVRKSLELFLFASIKTSHKPTDHEGGSNGLS